MRRGIQCALQCPQGQLGTALTMVVEHARWRFPANRLARVKVAGRTVSVSAAARMERRGERVFEGFEATGDNCHGWPMKRGKQPISDALRTALPSRPEGRQNEHSGPESHTERLLRARATRAVNEWWLRARICRVAALVRRFQARGRGILRCTRASENLP